MKQRPILFSAPMVRALRDGSKTQTRRVVKVRNEQPPAWATFAQEGQMLTTSGSCPSGLFYWSEEQAPTGPLKTLQRWPLSPPHHPMAGDHYWTPCPYGKPGDRLWVRETHAPRADCLATWDRSMAEGFNRMGVEEICYQATTTPRDWVSKWRPSIHMPRWASRLTLEIVSVRVERLQDISEADARAEGARECDPVSGREVLLAGPSQRGSYVLHYRDIWEQINGPGSWALNPWVWVVEFKRIAA